MEQDQLNTFRAALISLKEDTEHLIRDSSEAANTVTLDQSKVGRLSRMDALQVQQMAQETARRRQLQLQRIDSALRRMDAHAYGYCLSCDEQIVMARLEFDPATTRCIRCMDD